MAVRVLDGDCRDVLATLPADSVHCVVTSPPYWGLRDYGIPPTVWGGDGSCNDSDPQWYRCEDCNITKHISELTSGCPKCGQTMVPATGHHFELQTKTGQLRTGLGMAALGGQYRGGGHKAGEVPVISVEHGFCRCGAWHGAHGLEPTIDLYVKNAVEIFRAVRRVLRPDGTLWLNLGDSYATTPHGPVGANTSDPKYAGARHRGHSNGGEPSNAIAPNRRPQPGLKHKDLCGIPWRVAFALQADGWWLRQDIIWAKPNPMPESVTDRCTKAHEYLFLLTKSAKYFFDAEAVKEDSQASDDSRKRYEHDRYDKGGIKRADRTGRPDHLTEGGGYLGSTSRNKRSVWTVATSPFPEAHFATFPPELIEPCIKAGTSEKGCCAKCGAPWERQLEHSYWGDWFDGECDEIRLTHGSSKAPAQTKERASRTLGWHPSCDCDGLPGLPSYPPKPKDKAKLPEWNYACSLIDNVIERTCNGNLLALGQKIAVKDIAIVPAICLDPFGGAGTTGLVADRLQRNAILIELNPKYAEMARNRIFSDAPLFAGTAE